MNTLTVEFQQNSIENLHTAIQVGFFQEWIEGMPLRKVFQGVTCAYVNGDRMGDGDTYWFRKEFYPDMNDLAGAIAWALRSYPDARTKATELNAQYRLDVKHDGGWQPLAGSDFGVPLWILNREI